MANDVDRFIESFGTMVRLAQEAQRGSAKGREFIEALEGHLGAPPGTVPLVVEDVPNSRFVDADIILESLAGADARLVGIGGGDQRHHLSLSDVIQQAEAYATFPLSQPDYANLAVGPEAQRQVLKLIFSRQTMGRPFVAPPAIPADRRVALRAAFDQTMKDPGFLADAEKSKIEINPVGGAAIDAVVKDLYRTPPDVVALARKAVESDATRLTFDGGAVDFPEPVSPTTAIRRPAAMSRSMSRSTSGPLG